MPDEKKVYKIFWAINNRGTLESETHEMSFNDEDTFWEQIRYLTTINAKRGNTVNVGFNSRNKCTLTIWS